MLIIVIITPDYQTNYPLLYSKKDPRGSGFIYPVSIVIYAASMKKFKPTMRQPSDTFMYCYGYRICPPYYSYQEANHFFGFLDDFWLDCVPLSIN